MNADYSLAVHALVYLYHKQTSLTSEELAENICTNPARVRKVMATLKLSGLVRAKAGAEGGYYLPEGAGETSLSRVASAMDVEFVATKWKPGNVDMECLIASGMADIMDSVYAGLNENCLLQLEQITIASLEKRLVAGSKQA